jgi:5'-nucleotidase
MDARCPLWSRWSTLVVAAAALAALLGPARAQGAGPRARGNSPAGERLHLAVLHTNDLHGQVLERKAVWIDREEPPEIGGLPRVAAEIARQKRELESQGAGVLVLDAGDWFQGTPEGQLGRGAEFVRALAEVGYDVLVVGNHDFDHGVGHLRGLLAPGALPAVLANVFERAPGLGDDADARPGDPGAKRALPAVPPWRIFERAGLRIAVVGLLTPTTPVISHPETRELDFRPPAQTLALALEELDGEVDLVIPLTHCGLEEDRALALAFPALPLVVGGHSHTYLKEGERVGGTLIVQAGSKASALGRAELWIDPRTRSVVESRARLIDLTTDASGEARGRALEAACAHMVEASAAAMTEVVGELSADARRGSGLTSGSAGNWMCDVMRAAGAADVALHNRGGIRRDILKGPVTRRDLFEIMPFENTLVVLELSGAELADVIEKSIEGSGRSGLEVSGARVFVRPAQASPPVDHTPNKDAQGRTSAPLGELVRIEIGGRALDPERVYRVATNSFLAGGGDGYFARDGKLSDSGLLIREVLEQGFEGRRIQRPPDENRFVAAAR